MKKSVYEIVTDQIMTMLAQGVPPWKQPWKPGKEAINWFTGKAYRGINVLLTEPNGEYATWNQIIKAGGRVKREEAKRFSYVVFYTDYEKQDDDGEMIKIPVLRYYQVYNVKTQCEGLKLKRDYETETQFIDPIETAETLIKSYHDKPEIVYQGGRAVYNSFFDRVSVPPLSDYDSAEEYYCTLFHELAHSTGHKNRLDRKFGNAFGDVAYSKEELIAEITAAMMCGIAGIEQPIMENSTAYIKGWLKALKNDSTLIVKAANAAQKAADYMQHGKAKKEQLPA